jgi:hypothetical protein
MPIQHNCTLNDDDGGDDVSYTFVCFTVTLPKYVQHCLLQCNILNILTEHQTQTTREKQQKISQKILQIATENLHSANLECLSGAQK